MLLEHPSLLRRRIDLVKKLKHLMRRISKENVKFVGRQLGKLAHSMPAVVFDYVIIQIFKKKYSVFNFVLILFSCLDVVPSTTL